MRHTKEQASPDAIDPQTFQSHREPKGIPATESVLRVLLVDPEEELGHTRSLLFESLGRPVDVASNLATICSLPRDSQYCLVAVSINPKPSDLSSTLTTVRSLWPAARILLLGNSAVGIEDYQYDEMVDAAYHPADLVDVARRLISARPFTTLK
jgi:hypothetical protein